MPRITSAPGGQLTAPDGRFYSVFERAGASTYWAYHVDMNIMPDGILLNGVISPTVSGNNLTVALQTRSGGNPSSSDPINFWLNGVNYRVTGALSVTANAATNHCAAGSAETAAKSVDYFVYLGYRAASSAVVIGFSRIPFARVYSDFNSTATNALGSVWSTTPAATDNVFVIGRFAATLSAGAGYTWTVPTYTNALLVQHPIYKTRQLTWTPTPTGWSGTPTVVDGTYQIDYDKLDMDSYSASGTSSAAATTLSVPFTVTGTYRQVCRCIDNGAAQASPQAYISNTANIEFFKDFAGTALTGSGTKTVQQATFRVRLR